MVVAGTNFALLYAGIIGRRLGVFRRDEEFKVALGLLAAASLVVIVGLVSQDVLEGEEAVRAGVFNTVSMMTTTGFANADFNAVDVADRRWCCSASRCSAPRRARRAARSS